MLYALLDIRGNTLIFISFVFKNADAHIHLHSQYSLYSNLIKDIKGATNWVAWGYSSAGEVIYDGDAIAWEGE